MWSAHKAAVHARQHAGQYSQKRCAEFVSKSIRAGGANLQNTHYAKDMKSNLILAGFHRVYGEPVEGRCGGDPAHCAPPIWPRLHLWWERRLVL